MLFPSVRYVRYMIHCTVYKQLSIIPFARCSLSTFHFFVFIFIDDSPSIHWLEDSLHQHCHPYNPGLVYYLFSCPQLSPFTMHVLSDRAQVAESDSTDTLALPPSYSAALSEFSPNDIDKSKLTGTTNKAWGSVPRLDSDASTIFSAAETLLNPPRARSVLARGLQVPTRHHSVTSSYPYPEILHQAGISRDAWSAFTREVRKHASLSGSQWAFTIGGTSTFAIFGSIFMGAFVLIPAAIYGQRMRSQQERLNFILADTSGALAQCVSHWNRSFFRARGLAVRVDIPGRSRDMEHMDLASSKLYKNQHRADDRMYSAWHDGTKEQAKEGRARVRASLKARIVIIPLDHRHRPILTRPRPRSAFPGLDGAQDDEMMELEAEVAHDDTSEMGPLLRKRDPYPDEPKP